MLIIVKLEEQLVVVNDENVVMVEQKDLKLVVQ
jgi:hypothetical protein